MYGDMEIPEDMNIWFSVNEPWKYSFEEEFWPEPEEWEEDDDEWVQSRRERKDKRYTTAVGSIRGRCIVKSRLR